MASVFYEIIVILWTLWQASSSAFYFWWPSKQLIANKAHKYKHQRNNSRAERTVPSSRFPSTNRSKSPTPRCTLWPISAPSPDSNCPANPTCRTDPSASSTPSRSGSRRESSTRWYSRTAKGQRREWPCCGSPGWRLRNCWESTSVWANRKWIKRRRQRCELCILLY